ncbi:MAG: DUF3486 family protein [Maricaulaceae bacterium]|nr:DUF3486 family protein [Maricaulaceae bacterium]
MPARSAVERLPKAIRDTVEGWLKEFLAGRLTLDAVMDRLDAQWAMLAPDEPMPSRSSLHRHAQKFEAVAERLRRSKELTQMFAEAAGPQVADGKGLAVMVQAVQGLIYELLAGLGENDVLDPRAIHDLAKAAQHMAAAQKLDADRALKIEQEVRKKVAEEVQDEHRARGISDETADAVYKRILGLK